MKSNENYAEYCDLLRKMLNEKRYRHSLCVADEAQRLALKYGGNPEKCYLAGLLHDITKNLTAQEHLKIFDNFGIILSNIDRNAEKLWHAISGSAYIKNLLKIDDPEIFDAVRYHTTAKADMSLNSKILYLADFTSADRDYPDVEVIRKLVDESLDNAFVYALAYSIKDLAEQSRAIHPDTFKAYNQIVLKNGGSNGSF